MTRFFRVAVCFGAVLLGVQSLAGAQTPINSPGAMQPSTETGLWHVMPMYREIGSDPLSNVAGGREFILLSQAAYGVNNRLSVQFDAPVTWRDLEVTSGDDEEFGVADMTLLAKYRLWRRDPGPTDTIRVSLIAGTQIPGNVDLQMDSANDAWDPIIGAVFSTVHGRHGFNADALWEFYTGDEAGQADALRADTSYLFRILPSQYSESTHGALYFVTEINSFYGTNGDTEVYFSPGVMFESHRYTLDAMVMIPVYQDVDHRAESEFLVGVGFRISF